LFDSVLPIYLDAVVMAGVALEYTDVFFWSEEGNADCSEILNLESPLVASGAAQPLGLWHSHTGWFDHGTSGQRILANADVTIADAMTPEGVRRAINIRTHESSQFLTGAGDDLLDQSGNQNIVMAILMKHHDTLKNRLSSMLTYSGRDLISLGTANV
jgi:hypothetical protein